MSNVTLRVESANLDAIAVMNGRTKADVQVRFNDNKVILHSDELNPTNAKQRDAFVENLKEDPAFLRLEATSLLEQLGTLVMVERMKIKPNNKEMQGQELSLPTIEPWEYEVDGAELLDEIATMVRRFIVLPDAERDAVALHAMHAHALEAAQISPILIITAAQKSCGKSNCGTVYGALTPRSLSAANLTPATLFRAVEAFSPTLIADEVDTYLGEKEELRGLINAGHVRSRARLLRTVGDDHTPRSFSVWGAKALIGIRATTLNDATVSRGIVIELKRKKSTERVEQLRFDRIDGICHDIRRRAARWAADHMDALREIDPTVPQTLNDRAADNWRPLLAIADEVGGDWSSRARAAAVLLSGIESDSSEESVGALLLSDLEEFFGTRSTERIPSADIVAWLNQREERPWPEWKRGQPITARGLARLLEPFHIKPKVHRIGEETHRSYDRGDFNDAFARYLPEKDEKTGNPPSPSVTSVTLLGHNDLRDSQTVTQKKDVTLVQARNSLQDNDVTDVTHRKGVSEESYEECERRALEEAS